MPDLPNAGPARLAADGPVLLFGGPYSNRHALAALFAAAGRLGIPPARIVCTGDVVAYGADAGACVALLRRSGAAVVAGNCEEQLGAGAGDCGCGFAPGSGCDRLAAAWYAHADRTLDGADRAWMRALPSRLALEVGGRRLLVVHGGVDRSNRLVFASDEAEIERQLALAGVDGVVAGHCGLPFTRLDRHGLWHNPGVIGLPANDGTPRSWFSVLTPGPAGLAVAHHALDYDTPAAAAAMEAAGLPAAYAVALRTGLWPSCDVLPAAELARRGQAYAEGALVWAEDGPAAVTSPTITWPGPPAPAARARFADPLVTAAGERRASVTLEGLRTLWFNTGTLCNVACAGCYIESSPTNDRLAYLGRAEALVFLAEARQRHPELAEVGFTGGEPFMNRDVPAMIGDALDAGHRVLVLTNAMRPMQRAAADLAALVERHRERLTLRVSLDHHTAARHEAVRGPRSWAPAIEGLRLLVRLGARVTVAGRTLWDEPDAALREGYRALFADLGLRVDAFDPAQLVLFPEMDGRPEVPEITERCWDLLGRRPGEMMCAGSRMVVKRRGAARPAVVSCTLLPYDDAFELGGTLVEASGPVALNHRFCAQFCVLGGASCSPRSGGGP